MSQKKARQARQETRAAGQNPALQKIARSDWSRAQLAERKAKFAEWQATRAKAEAPKVRKTRSQKLIEETAAAE